MISENVGWPWVAPPISHGTASSSKASDASAMRSVAFELEAVPWEIGGATHAHPTLSEVLGEAAMAVDGRSINF